MQFSEIVSIDITFQQFVRTKNSLQAHAWIKTVFMGLQPFTFFIKSVHLKVHLRYEYSRQEFKGLQGVIHNESRIICFKDISG